MRKGITIVELLVVIVITSVLGAGIFALYRSLVGGAAEQSTVMRNEAQVKFVLDNLAKLLSNAGFGIERGRLDYGNDNVINVANSNILPSANELTILTRASTQEANAGCWGIIDQNGNFMLVVNSTNPDIQDRPPVSSTLNRPCPDDADAYGVRISIQDKSLRPNCQRNCLAFPNLPANTVSVYLDNLDQRLNRQCLNGTGRLMLDMNGAGEIISCVGHLRFRYLAIGPNDTVVAQDQPPPYENLVGVRLCMMVQLSDTVPQTTPQEPSYTERCVGQDGNARLTQLNPALANNWRLRRWYTVEMDIFMPNLH